MGNRIDMTGQVFGRLTVQAIGKTVRHPSGRVGRLWLCSCSCGGAALAERQSLLSGNTKSCGCLKIEVASARLKTHGMSKSRAYSIWSNMLTRCRVSNSAHWKRYGGRGVAVCDRWLSFESFLADMGEPPNGYSLDRIDNNKGYEPGNCRWANQTEQCRNRSDNHVLTLNGKSQCISAWAEELGVNERTIRSRIRLGWDDKAALSTPVNTSLGQYDRTNMRRKKPSYSERLAAVLLMLKKGDGSPVIPPEIAAKGTKAILSHVEWDHITPLAMGGDDAAHNLQPLTVEDHAAKTKKDVKAIAKVKRLTKEQEEFRRKVLARPCGAKRERSKKWPSRPMRTRRK